MASLPRAPKGAFWIPRVVQCGAPERPSIPALAVTMDAPVTIT
jgi:hypothetical protein